MDGGAGSRDRAAGSGGQSIGGERRDSGATVARAARRCAVLLPPLSAPEMVEGQALAGPPGRAMGSPEGSRPALLTHHSLLEACRRQGPAALGAAHLPRGPHGGRGGPPAEAGAAGPSCGQEETISQRSRFQCLNFVCFSYKNAFHFLPCLLLFMLEVRKSKCTI